MPARPPCSACPDAYEKLGLMLAGLTSRLTVPTGLPFNSTCRHTIASTSHVQVKLLKRVHIMSHLDAINSIRLRVILLQNALWAMSLQI